MHFIPEQVGDVGLHHACVMKALKRKRFMPLVLICCTNRHRSSQAFLGEQWSIPLCDARRSAIRQFVTHEYDGRN